jgi:TPR repeat protein
MNLSFRALCYLHAFDNRLPIQNGLAFERQLRGIRLDYSVQSLERIDHFFDALRASGRIRQDSYLGDPSQQNLLYLLAFYVGEVIARSLGSQAHWYSYEEVTKLDPGSQINGPLFENSATLAFPDHPDVATKTFMPLVSLTSRLFDEHVTKSVLFSAGFLLPPQSEAESAFQQPLPPLVAAAWPIDVAKQVRESSPQVQAKLDIMQPPWAAGDALCRQFDNARVLLQEGRVVWGALIQANNALFQPHPEGGAPGEVLYDPLGRAPTDVLEAVSKVIFGLKGKAFDEPDFAYFSNYLADEHIRVFGLDVPTTIVPYPLKVSSIYFDRQHLPGGLLAQRLLPILISDAHPGVATPLPKVFWPDYLRSQWAPNDVNDTIPDYLKNAHTQHVRDYAPFADPALYHLEPYSFAEEGLHWYRGTDVRQNYEKARIAWEKSAATGNAAGQNGLGMLYEDGLGVAADLQRALAYFELAAAQDYGVAKASADRVRRRLRGEAPQLTIEEPARSIDITVTQGELDYVRGLLSGEAIQAPAQKFSHTTEPGDSKEDVLFHKGMANAMGDGVPQNSARARHYWSLAADLGHAPSMHNLATLHANGAGGKADFKTAVKYFRQAGDIGFAPAQLELGKQHLRKGSGIYSRKEAFKWLTLAAEQDSAEAKTLIEEQGLQDEEPGQGFLSRLFGRR